MAKGKYVQWLQPDNLLRLQAWARDGATDAEIAERIGIGRDTLYLWKKKYPDISDTLKRGKEVVDRQVENALLKRALGFDYNETTKELCKNPETGEINLKVTKVVTKHVAPDVTAQIFWLKNRMREKWSDRQNIEISKPIDESIKEMEEYFEQQKKADS